MRRKPSHAHRGARARSADLSRRRGRVGEPHWLTRQPLLPGVIVTFGISALFGAVSGRRRAIVAPLVFGVLVGVIAAVASNGDLGRGGELALGVVWGVALAGAMAVGIWFRSRMQR